MKSLPVAAAVATATSAALAFPSLFIPPISYNSPA